MLWCGVPHSQLFFCTSITLSTKLGSTITLFFNHFKISDISHFVLRAPLCDSCRNSVVYQLGAPVAKTVLDLEKQAPNSDISQCVTCASRVRLFVYTSWSLALPPKYKPIRQLEKDANDTMQTREKNHDRSHEYNISLEGPCQLGLLLLERRNRGLELVHLGLLLGHGAVLRRRLTPAAAPLVPSRLWRRGGRGGGRLLL